MGVSWTTDGPEHDQILWSTVVYVYQGRTGYLSVLVKVLTPYSPGGVTPSPFQRISSAPWFDSERHS